MQQSPGTPSAIFSPVLDVSARRLLLAVRLFWEVAAAGLSEEIGIEATGGSQIGTESAPLQRAAEYGGIPRRQSHESQDQ